MHDSDERISRIRARAYQIWEQNGQPEGTHEEDWRLAAQQVAAETGEDGSAPQPAVSGGSTGAGEETAANPFASAGSDGPAVNEPSQSPSSSPTSSRPGSRPGSRPAPAGRAKASKR